MNVRKAFTYRIALILPTIGIVMAAFSAFLFSYLDHLVHGDLYRYGLQFNYEWAGPYWVYSRLLTESLAIAIVALGISIIVLLLKSSTNGTNNTDRLYILLILIGVAAIASSALFFSKLDYIVNTDLYRYGLKFDYAWAGKYWTYTRLILTLFGFMAALDASTIALMATSRWAHGTNPFYSSRKLLQIFSSVNSAIVVLFGSGVLAAIIAVSVSSSVLALLGLGLVFWSVVLLYIKPEKYAKETLLENTTVQLTREMAHLVENLGYGSTAVFLPAASNDIDSCRVYVGPKASATLRWPEENLSGENASFSRFLSTKGLLLTPTGLALAKLIKSKVGKSLEKNDLRNFGQQLHNVLIEDLEIVHDVKIESSNPKFRVQLIGSAYSGVFKETGKSSKFHTSIGCPICSAIACLLANYTGKPVIIEKDQVQDNGQIIDVEYRVL